MRRRAQSEPCHRPTLNRNIMIISFQHLSKHVGSDVCVISLQEPLKIFLKRILRCRQKNSKLPQVLSESDQIKKMKAT